MTILSIIRASTIGSLVAPADGLSGKKKVFNTVKDTVLSAANATSLTQALVDLNIPKRTFNRKRPIAELYILENQAFRTVRDEIAAESGGRRFNQGKLAEKCTEILNRPDMKVKRRVALTEGLVV